MHVPRFATDKSFVNLDFAVLAAAKFSAAVFVLQGKA
jgi:hypothetical protein